MFRTRRVGAALVRTLLFASAVPATFAATTLLVSCQDESQPEYWLEQLQDDAWRPRAIKRLDQFYEDALTRANQNEDAPEVKTLADKILPPLTGSYVDHYDALDEKGRLRLIKLLATARDPRTEPALTKALAEFGKKGRGAEEAKWAARAVADLKLEASAPAMLQAYSKTRAGTKEGGILYRDLSTSMVSFAHQSWVPQLVDKLGGDMRMPQKKDPQAVAEFKNQLFWQTTAAQVLGVIGSAEAVAPLMKVVLDPGKASAHATSIMALVKTGEPAASLAARLLLGKHPDLEKFAAEKTKVATGAPQLPRDRPHVPMAAIVLGTIGRADSAGVLQAALAAEKIENNRAVIARELSKLPPSRQSKVAFLSAFEKLSPNASIGHLSAHEVLAEASVGFFDADLVPWLLAKASAKGVDPSLGAVARQSAIKLMGSHQLGDVGKAVDSAKDPNAQRLFRQSSKVVRGCKKDVACYLAELRKADNQSESNQFAGIKAAYMLGVLGDASTRPSLVDALADVNNAAVRFVVARAIDHLSPKGSAEVADALGAIIEKNARGKDRKKMAADAALKEVMYRIRSRSKS